MSVRFQRLLIIVLSLVFLTISVFLILINSKKNLIYFFTPSELINSDIQINNTVRIGGFVAKGSIKKNKNNEYTFVITDNKKNVNIVYRGLLPDLFREGQGAVIEGILIKNYLIKATNVFAKHDENYIPATLKDQLKNSDYWKKDYE